MTTLCRNSCIIRVFFAANPCVYSKMETSDAWNSHRTTDGGGSSTSAWLQTLVDFENEFEMNKNYLKITFICGLYREGFYMLCDI